MSVQGPLNTRDNPKKFKPYVPEQMEMREFTLRAVLLGLLLTVVLGAANAYLGLRAGITIAATYPAAVIAKTSPVPLAQSGRALRPGRFLRFLHF
jgi:hypothetical protein